MANKKISNKMLSEEMQNKGLKTEDQVEDFMNGMIGKSIDDIDFGTPSKEEEAQNLLYQAYDSRIKEGRELAEEALALDPNNADIYNYLADIEPDIEKALKLYEQGVKAGEKKLGKKTFKEDKGYFWDILETRPYMRSKAGLAKCLTLAGKEQEVIAIYWDMLDLNPNDNQGVRYSLCSLLLKTKDFKAYEKLYKLYRDDGGVEWNYNRVLYYFQKGNMVKAKSQLQEAINTNKHVIPYLVGKKRLPKNPPSDIGFGDFGEAVAYVMGNKELWKATEGSLEFLEKID